jgi:hypothetical protein
MPVYFALAGFHNPFRWCIGSLIGDRKSLKNVNKATNKKKNVSFAAMKTIILIPTRLEYKEANIDIWWNDIDYSVFKLQMLRDKMRIVRSKVDFVNFHILLISDRCFSSQSTLLSQFSFFLDTLNTNNEKLYQFVIDKCSHSEALSKLNNSNYYYNIIIIDNKNEKQWNCNPMVAIALTMFRLTATIALVCLKDQDKIKQDADVLSFSTKAELTHSKQILQKSTKANNFVLDVKQYVDIFIPLHTDQLHISVEDWRIIYNSMKKTHTNNFDLKR